MFYFWGFLSGHLGLGRPFSQGIFKMSMFSDPSGDLPPFLGMLRTWDSANPDHILVCVDVPLGPAFLGSCNLLGIAEGTQDSSSSSLIFLSMCSVNYQERE